MSSGRRRVIYSLEARLDIHSVFDYIRLDNPPAVDTFLEELDQTVQRVASFPRSGFVPKEKALKARGYRCAALWEYLLFYRFTARALWIVRLIHGRRYYVPMLMTPP